MRTTSIAFLFLIQVLFSQVTFDTTIYVGSNPFSIKKYEVDSLRIAQLNIDGPNFTTFLNFLDWNWVPGDENLIVQFSLMPYEDEFVLNGDTVRAQIRPAIIKYMDQYVLIEGLNMIYNEFSIWPDSITFRFTENYPYTSLRSRYTGKQYFRNGKFNLLGQKNGRATNYSEVLFSKTP